ncbi:MAG: membrane dipeptidase [Planctomycetota bacterium]
MNESMKGVSDEAIALTKDSLVVDIYTTSFDLAYRALKSGGKPQVPGWFAKRGEEIGAGAFAGRFDLPRIKEGGLNVFGQSMLDSAISQSMFAKSNEYELSVEIGRRHEGEGDWPADWGKFAWPPDPYDHYVFQYPPRSGLANSLVMYEILMREIDAIEDLILVTKTDDILRTQKEGKVGIFFDCNCVQMIEDSLEMLSVLYRLGYRQMLLARFSRNLVVDSWVQSRTGGGLTPFGEAAVREMNRIGMIIDLSHTSDPGFWDVLEVSDDPVICSHSNARAVHYHPRNLTDDQIKAIAQKGGVIGLMCVFIGPGKEHSDMKSWNIDDPRFQKWLDHYDHMFNLVGPDYLGWGSDGYITMIATPAEIPKLTEGLLRRGHSEQDIRKFLGENYLRVFRDIVR